MGALYTAMSDIIYLLFYRLFRRMPQGMRSLATWGFGGLFYLLAAERRRIAGQMLQIVYAQTLSESERKRIARRSFESLVDTFMETMRNTILSPVEIRAKLSFVHAEYVREAQRQGRKIIFVGGHFGNWELMVQGCAMEFGPGAVITRPLDSAPMEEIFAQSRSRFDIRVIHKRGALLGAAKSLTQGRNLGILVDQRPKKGVGVAVTFLGQPAMMSDAASQLALKFDALIIPIFCRKIDVDRYEIFCDTPIDPRPLAQAEDAVFCLTQAQADAITRTVMLYPEQYMWMHRRWKTPPTL